MTSPSPWIEAAVSPQHSEPEAARMLRTASRLVDGGLMLLGVILALLGNVSAGVGIGAVGAVALVCVELVARG